MCRCIFNFNQSTLEQPVWIVNSITSEMTRHDVGSILEDFGCNFDDTFSALDFNTTAKDLISRAKPFLSGTPLRIFLCEETARETSDDIWDNLYPMP